MKQFLALCKQADYGQISPQELWAQIAQLMQLSLGECKTLIEADRHANHELLQYIREELAGNYKLGMLSNACADIWSYLTPDTQELFDSIVISADIQRCKPDAEAYHEICRRLEVLPEESIMIDDRIENCIGAKQAGLQAIQYESFATLRAELSDMLVVA